MLYDPHDTIAALATLLSPAPRAIVRLSGPRTLECLAGLFHSDDGRPLVVTRAACMLPGELKLPAGHVPCDLYLWPDGRSYTRQPAAELHMLGSPPLAEQALRAACAAGVRLAEPGEFTLRAFLAGRIDLAQAEAVLGVVDAQSQSQLDVALAQLAGGLSRPLARLRGALLDLLAHLEAGLDFVEEEIEFITPGELDEQLATAAQTVEDLLQQMQGRGQSGAPLRVVLIGAPNAGKSSLFNALAGHLRAIVSNEPGTTRDYLVAELDLDGVACELIDTAGLEADEPGESCSVTAHATLDEPEPLPRMIQDMAAQQHRQANLRLVCLDASRPLADWERERLLPLGMAREASEEPEALLVLTKVDLPRRIDAELPAIATSSVTGEGLESLRRELARRTAGHAAESAFVVSGTSTRCRESLRLACQSLERARELTATSGGHELVALELRAALDELGKVIGAVYTDDVLDRIFSRFCIGK